MMMRRVGCWRFARVMILELAVAGALPGQAANDQRAAFEVASIRSAAGAGEGTEGSSRSQVEGAPDGVTMRNVELSEIIEWAYGLQQYQLVKAAPISRQRYDLRAKTGDRVAEATLRRMMQDLLATRFKLQIHREQKKTSVYELVVASGGARLTKDKSDSLPSGYPRESLPHVVDGGFVFSNVSMEEFAQQLTELRGIDLPVVDRTGIAGVYDITFKGAASAILDPQGPSLLTLIQEQLGLKLVGAKDPIEVVVVEHAEKPSED